MQKKNFWVKFVAWSCMIAILINSSAHVVFAQTSEAPVPYTVTMTDADELLLYSKKASDGPVTIQYTVESSNANGWNAEHKDTWGAVATTDSSGKNYLGSNGSGRYHLQQNFLYPGTTYKYVISTNAETGMVEVEAYQNDVKSEGKFYAQYYSYTEGSGNKEAAYFGIYLDAKDSLRTAVLKNVTCTDAQGNDLGIQSNSDKAVVKSNAPIPYTVTLSGTEELLLFSQQASSGPVTIQYTVESSNANGWNAEHKDNWGVVATTDGTGNDYLSDKGSMRQHLVQNFLYPGTTYKYVISTNAETGMVEVEAYQNGVKSEGKFYTSGYCPTYGNGNTASNYFAIYLDASDSPRNAVLKDVICTDAHGNNLGIQSNSENVTIKSDIKEPPVPVTLTLTEAKEIMLLSKKTSNGPVTIEYTVDSSNANGWNAEHKDTWGAVATTDSTGKNYLGSNGSVRYHLQQNFLYPGTTYKYVISTNAETGMVEVELYQNGVKSEGKFYTEGHCPTEGDGNKAANYFGVYLDAKDSPRTAVLKNVTCVDAEGNDLGVELIDITKLKPVGKTITLTDAKEIMLQNEKVGEGAITIEYTVESSNANGWNAEHKDTWGAVATTDSSGKNYLGSNGSGRYHLQQNFLYPGTTYKYVISTNAETGMAEVELYQNGVKSEGKFYTAGYCYTEGDGNKDSNYFGVYLDAKDSPRTAVLKNVTCVDAKGNDLGVQFLDITKLKPATQSFTLTDAKEILLLSDKAAQGPVAIEYTVKSSNANGWNEEHKNTWGVVATTDSTGEDYLGANGSIRYHLKQNFLYPKTTYKYVISTNAETGMVEVECYQNGQKADKFYTNGYCYTEGDGNKESNHFGIYFSSVDCPRTVELEEVSCVDAAGNNLGIKLLDVSKPEAATSTIILQDAGEVALLSKTAAEGPITLQYTVTRSNADGWNAEDKATWGVIGTIDASGKNYKGNNGSIRYHLQQNFLYPNTTYKYVISTNAETGMVEVELYQNGVKSEGKFYTSGYCPTEGNGNVGSKYFGIYLNAVEHPKTAVLTNVICQDANGKNLGVKAIGSGATVMADSELPGEFSEITYEHFGLESQTVKGGSTASGKWLGATNLDEVAFVGTIQFGETKGEVPARTEMLVIGGKTAKTTFEGLQIYYQGESLMLLDGTGATTKNYGILGSISETKAGVPLKNAPIDLRVSFKYVNEKDVRIRVRINGVECFDKTVEGMGEKLGTYLIVSASKNPMAIQSSKSSALLPYTSIDFAEFGFTEKWAYTLGLKK